MKKFISLILLISFSLVGCLANDALSKEEFGKCIDYIASSVTRNYCESQLNNTSVKSEDKNKYKDNISPDLVDIKYGNCIEVQRLMGCLKLNGWSATATNLVEPLVNMKLNMKEDSISEKDAYDKILSIPDLFAKKTQFGVTNDLIQKLLEDIDVAIKKNKKVVPESGPAESIKEQFTTYEEQNEDSMNTYIIWGSLAVIVVAIVFLFLKISYLTLLDEKIERLGSELDKIKDELVKLKNNGANVGSNIKTANNVKSEDLNNLKEQISNISSSLIGLTEKVQRMETFSKSQSVSHKEPSSEGKKTTPPTKKINYVYWYADSPEYSGDSFNDVVVGKPRNTSMFVIEEEPGNVSAKFYVHESDNAVSNFLENRNLHAKFTCECEGTGPKFTQVPGTVEKQNDGTWKIKTKAKLKFS